MEAENRTEREPNEKIDAKNDQEMRICGSTEIMKCAAPRCQTEEDNETIMREMQERIPLPVHESSSIPNIQVHSD